VQVGAASTSSIALLPVPVNRREDALERAAEQRRPSVVEPAEQQAPQREAIKVRVRASAAAQQASNQAQEVLRDLQPRQRSALQSYLSNGPSMEERLGVDLAGIDVYA
jgi:hypothetical protein